MLVVVSVVGTTSLNVSVFGRISVRPDNNSPEYVFVWSNQTKRITTLHDQESSEMLHTTELCCWGDYNILISEHD
jgi:hypothetical protein